MILALPWVPVVMTPACDPVNDRACGAERLDGHRDQRVGDALTRGEQHVHFARGRGRADLSGQVEQVIGGVAHGGDDHDDVVALLLGLDDALSDATDPLGVRNR